MTRPYLSSTLGTCLPFTEVSLGPSGPGTPETPPTRCPGAGVPSNPKGPNLETNPSRLKFSTLLEKLQSCLKTSISRDRKNHDRQRRDRILLFFLRPGHEAMLSTFWGHFLTKLHSKPGEKGKKKTSTGENSQKSVKKLPRNCRFLSLVVVERVLNLACKFQSLGCTLSGVYIYICCRVKKLVQDLGFLALKLVQV